MAIISEDSCLQPGQSRKFSEITDGTSKTIILVEVPANRSVPWMAPEDLSEEQLLEVLKAGTTNHSGGVFIVAIADGSVRTLTSDIDPQLLHALMTASSKEDTNLPD